MKKSLPYLLFALFFTLFLSGQLLYEKTGSPSYENDFPYYDELLSLAHFSSIDGKEIDLANMNSQYILFVFWASWCPNCLAAIPDLVQLRRQKSEQEIFIVGINIDEEKNKDRVEQIISDYKINFPQVLDTGGSISTKFKIKGIPTSILFKYKKTYKILNRSVEVSDLD